MDVLYFLSYKQTAKNEHLPLLLNKKRFISRKIIKRVSNSLLKKVSKSRGDHKKDRKTEHYFTTHKQISLSHLQN